MKITLATHIVVEHVGNQVFLLDSVGKEVYCLPAEGIAHYAPETKTLVVTPELLPEVERLIESGVATTTGLVSRRAVVGSTGALIGGGLVAMSMPAAAASQSPGPGQNTNGGGHDDLGDFDFFASGTWKGAGGGGMDVDIVFPMGLLPPDFDWYDEEWSIELLGKNYKLGDGLYFDDGDNESLKFEVDDKNNAEKLTLLDLWEKCELEDPIIMATLRITLSEQVIVGQVTLTASENPDCSA